MHLDSSSIAALIVAAIAAISAYASQRAAARVSKFNVSTTSRVDMEKEAYERARKFDVETINRQDIELNQLIEANNKLRADLSAREIRIVQLLRYVASIEEKLGHLPIKEILDE